MARATPDSDSLRRLQGAHVAVLRGHCQASVKAAPCDSVQMDPFDRHRFSKRTQVREGPP